ncbi:mitochondrial carrier [Pholiota conissans]|uniref:Mitochondrial carrier n=1 Tax=Pholiota conissans TaxID=109636 RepID=A0A9P6CZY2_9AGAR|nr:mitochondrial carrier [Pholiota conissans]
MTSTLPPLVQAFSGAIGSASANALSYPFNLVTTKLQLDSPRRSKDRGGFVGGIHLLLKIIRKHGVDALYDGLGADTIATLLSSFFYFYIYSFLRFLSTKRLVPFLGRNSQSHKRHKPSLFEELILGFIAGVASRAVATPLNIITLRMQTERTHDDDDDYGDDEVESEEPKYQGITEIVKLIYKEQGLAGFWRGFQMSILLSLNPSITMAFVQMYRRTFHALESTSVMSSQLKHHSKHYNANLHAWEAFFGGAISNSIAVTILYPLILGKKRLQASSTKTSIPEVLVDAYLGKDLDFQRHGSIFIDHGEFGQSEKAVGGIQGLYQGYQLKIVSNFLSQGVSYLVKNRIERLVIAAYLYRLKRGQH